MTNKEIAAAALLEEYTDLTKSLRELELEHEGLFMQRKELEGAASNKLTQFKEAVKNEGITYLANSTFVVTAEQTYRKVELKADVLANRCPQLIKAGVITAEKTISYEIDKKRLKGAIDLDLITQADLDAATPKRAPYAYPVTIQEKGT